MMTIRPLRKEDIGACATIFVNTYNQAPWHYDWQYSNALTYLNEYFYSGQFVGFVLIDGAEMAGALFGHSKTWWTNNQLFIDELFISPAKQKMGCGSQLINHTEKYALDNGLETMTLITNKFMPAMEFYDRQDYIHAQSFVILFKQL